MEEKSKTEKLELEKILERYHASRVGDITKRTEYSNSHRQEYDHFSRMTVIVTEGREYNITRWEVSDVPQSLAKKVYRSLPLPDCPEKKLRAKISSYFKREYPVHGRESDLEKTILTLPLGYQITREINVENPTPGCSIPIGICLTVTKAESGTYTFSVEKIRTSYTERKTPIGREGYFLRSGGSEEFMPKYNEGYDTV